MGGPRKGREIERGRREEERERGRRKAEAEISWWRDAGVADTRWEVEDGDRLRRSCEKADGGVGTEKAMHDKMREGGKEIHQAGRRERGSSLAYCFLC